MNSVTQDMKFRLSLINYAKKHRVFYAARKYRTNRQYIYRLLKRYDGSIESLREKSRRPKKHPNQHSDSEIQLIRELRRRNPHAGLVVFWVKLRQRGYQRFIPGLWRMLNKLSLFVVLRLKTKSSCNAHPLF